VIPHHHEAEIAPLTMNGHEWIVLAIGFVVSFFVALAVVAWFMNWVRERGFVPFAVYRIVLGIGLLTLLVRGIM
jgi:undecaprenyl-diphosphatase